MELYDVIKCIMYTSADIYLGGDGFIAYPDSVHGDLPLPVLIDRTAAPAIPGYSGNHFSEYLKGL